MTQTDYAAMSIDELESLSGELKTEQFAIRQRRRDILQERTRKVFIQRIRNEIARSPLAKAAMDAGLFVIDDDLPFERAAAVLHHGDPLERERDERPRGIRDPEGEHLQPRAGCLRLRDLAYGRRQ